MTSRSRRLAVSLLAAAMVVAACGASVTSPAVTLVPPTEAAASAATSESPAETPIDGTPTGEPSAPPEDGQTDTDWGRIWDRLPAGFPVYPESVIAEEAASGPASAVYVVARSRPGGRRRMVPGPSRAGCVQHAGPVGSARGRRATSSIPSGGTRHAERRSRIAPLGGTILVTVRYGAGCPLG